LASSPASAPATASSARAHRVPDGREDPDLALQILKLTTAFSLGTIGRKIKKIHGSASEVADRIIGVAIILIGVYFLYLAFR
jgi:hypothetical protein